MKKFLVGFLCLVFVSLLSGCQAFFEDYSYQPLGPASSSSAY